MDIELTSERPDGTWTWRAAGALKPRGVVEAATLAPGAKVGDVLRVEAEIELDGITITSVVPAKAPSPREGVIEIARSAPPSAGVTTTLVERGPSRSRRGSDRARFDGADTRGRGQDRTTGARRPGAAGSRTGLSGGQRPGAAERARGTERRGSTVEAPGDRPPAGVRHDRTRSGAPFAERPAGDAAARPARARQPRLVPGRARLAALLGSLPPEHVPVAEQLAVGGLPAVRRALSEERAAAAAAGRPIGTSDAIVALAEQLLPAVREAAWLDRAEAADKMLDTISLRDLRATVAGAAPRDEHGREILQRLREALDARVAKLRLSWEADVVRALEENRVLQALRLSARPPEPTARFPAALVTRLAEVTGAAMTAETPPERWLALLEAAVASPVRRLVKPAGVPADGELRRTAAREAGRIPALAGMLGLPMPPPPGPPAGAPPVVRRRPGPPPPPHQPPRAPAATSSDAPGGATAAPAPGSLEHADAPEPPVASGDAHEGEAASLLVEPTPGSTPPESGATVVSAPSAEAEADVAHEDELAQAAAPAATDAPAPDALSGEDAAPANEDLRTEAPGAAASTEPDPGTDREVDPSD